MFFFRVKTKPKCSCLVVYVIYHFPSLTWLPVNALNTASDAISTSQTRLLIFEIHVGFDVTWRHFVYVFPPHTFKNVIKCFWKQVNRLRSRTVVLSITNQLLVVTSIKQGFVSFPLRPIGKNLPPHFRTLFLPVTFPHVRYKFLINSAVEHVRSRSVL